MQFRIKKYMHRTTLYSALLTAALLAAEPSHAAPPLPGLSLELRPMFYARHNPGYLGVDIRDVTEDQLSALKLPATRGAEIITVDHDAPAGKAGLREHDVILQINGTAIDNADHVHRLLREIPPGRTVTLVISRDGQQLTISAQLANRAEEMRRAWDQHYVPGPPPDDANADMPPPPPGAGRMPGNGFAGNGMAPGGFGASRGLFASPLIGPRATYTGAMLEPVGQLADLFGVKPGLGLLVKNIDPDSPAAAAGLKPGDVVTRVNSTDIAQPDDWFRIVRDSKGKPLQLTIIRNKQEQTLTLTPTEFHRTHGALGPMPQLQLFDHDPTPTTIDALALVINQQIGQLQQRLQFLADLDQFLNAPDF